MFASLLGDIRLEYLEISDDVKAALRALNSLGVSYENGKFSKVGGAGISGTIDVGGSGTVLRFLLPVLSSLGLEATITGDETLRKRPLGILHEFLNSNGVDLSNDHLPLRISGKLDADRIEISGSESSQYISGFIFGKLLGGGGKISLLPPVRSSSYISMTCRILNSIGARIRYTGNFIEIEDQRDPLKYSGNVPGDFLLSSFYAIGAVLSGGKVRIENHIMPDWSAGDARIVDIMGKYAASSSLSEGTWSVEAGEGVQPFHEDVQDSPDLAVNLAALAYGTSEESTISGIELLKIKESDRIRSISHTLRQYGSRVETNDVLKIRGPPDAKPGVTEQWNDHRIAMLGSILSLKAGGVVKGSESVSKSNPRFFDDLRKLGGDIRLE